MSATFRALLSAEVVFWKALLLIAAISALLLAGCKARIPEGVLACNERHPCPPGYECYEEFCFSSPPDGLEAGEDAAICDGGCPPYEASDVGGGSGGTGGSGGSDGAETGGMAGTTGGGEGGGGTGGDEPDAGADSGDAVTPECDAENPCANGWPCESGICTPECDGDNPCDQYYRCDEGLCVPECDEDHPCDPGYLCSEDGFCLPDSRPTIVVVTSGGGTVTSASFNLRVSVGMPQPIGVTEGAIFRTTVGPGAGRP